MDEEKKEQNKRNKTESIPKQYGWICPKCGSVWAPWIAQCKNCKSNYDYTSPATWDFAPYYKCENI